MPDRRSFTGEGGYAMAALIVLLGVMAVALMTALPVWSTQAKREKEEEMIFRAQQYARAITLFQRKYAGAYPPSIDVLVNERFLRRKYLDPLTGKDFQTVGVGEGISLQTETGRGAAGGRLTPPPRPGDDSAGGRGRTGGTPPANPFTSAFGQSGTAGGGVGAAGASAGILGVRSTSTEKAMRLWNGREYYSEWVFTPTQGNRAEGVATPDGGVQGGQVPGPGGANAPGGAAGGRGARGATPFGGGRGANPQRGRSPF